MRLVWSQLAVSDRRAIFDWISEDDPEAAAELDELVEEAAQRLVKFPEIGRPGRVEGTRELVITNTPYVAPCQIIGSKVRILRVLHGVRLWPDSFSLDE